jgi:hypothetical protein
VKVRALALSRQRTAEEAARADAEGARKAYIGRLMLQTSLRILMSASGTDPCQGLLPRLTSQTKGKGHLEALWHANKYKYRRTYRPVTAVRHTQSPTRREHSIAGSPARATAAAKGIAV